ncbi:hypothetical protein BS47DRAFT_1372518 [Hydnum rufescens UP504]|uniref:Uncharacterized protein n=1 Tax=Hydnum rufescens UP504 TaxID=1448309 RepID=A0A9P6AX90_9AGAM|nr:hypothetical protein BS47DRAFT_1372518 [Hydnum rufescens UP504]
MRAAQKIPEDADYQICHALLQQALSIRDYNIPAALRVNSDQTQVIYHQSSSLTYDAIGVKQVSAISQEEKRAFTLNVAVSATIYQSKSLKSLPSPTCDGYDEAMALGFRFESSMTDTYWVTGDTMKSFIQHILVPYFTAKKVKLSLPLSHEAIWQIDVWPVHTSEDLRAWLFKFYPWIILSYVPGGCTGLFQPCDVGIQHILKHSVQRTQHGAIVEEVLCKLEDGKDPKSIHLDTSVITL